MIRGHEFILLQQGNSATNKNALVILDSQSVQKTVSLGHPISKKSLIEIKLTTQNGAHI